jgi:hypothetical protein
MRCLYAKTSGAHNKRTLRLKQTEEQRERWETATSTSQRQFPSLYLFDWKLSSNALAPINSIANDEKVVKTLAAPLNNIVDCSANKYTRYNWHCIDT